MLGFLWRTIVGRFSRCDHKFEIYAERTVKTDYGDQYIRYHLRCTKCGDIVCRDMN